MAGWREHFLDSSYYIRAIEINHKEFYSYSYSKMDALAGYGSDSDSSDPKVVPSQGDKAASGISSLLALGLGQYSRDDSDDDTSGRASNNVVLEGVKRSGCQSSSSEAGDEKVNAAITSGQPTIKRRKRWDNTNLDVHRAVLPPPTLLTDATKKDSYQSLILFHKDYTTSLRHKLSQQLQTQSQRHEREGETSTENQQLTKTLNQLYEQFQQRNPNEGGDIHSGPAPPTLSFAAHLKSKREFGNPHLLKTIIDYFRIQPLESHVGNVFMDFEYVDRLISAEERARASAVNYDVSRGGDLGRTSGLGD